MSDLNTMLNEFVDVDSMLNEVEKTTTKKFWRPTLAKTTVRVLPPIKANSEKLPWFEHKVHWINSQPYECLNQTVVDKDGNLHEAEPCPICKMAKALYAAKTEDAERLAKTISAKTRYVSRVVVRDDKNVGNSPVFYELPFSIYNKFKTAILSKEWGTLVGPVDGRDMDIIREGEGKYSKYDASSFKPSTSKIFDDNATIVETLQNAKDMSYNSLVSFQSADNLKSVAMENEDIARFFGSKQEAIAPVRTIETAISNEDLVPEFKEDNSSSNSQSDDLDSLLAGLI